MIRGEIIQHAREFWDAGMSGPEIARKLGVTKAVIDGIARRSNFSPRPDGRLVDITGHKYGRVIALRRAGVSCGGVTWHCLCDCGREFITSSNSLRRGKTKSCGCYQSEQTSDANRRHGHSTRIHNQTRTYRIWGAMHNRCRNPSNISYRWYGAMGVKVCDRWKDFRNFLADMGEAPLKLSIDRFPDSWGDYEPGNCRWATSLEQRHNRRDSITENNPCLK